MAETLVSGAGGVSGVAHVGFTVRDVDSASRFYSGLFGVEPEVHAVYDRPYTAEQVGYEDAKLDIAIFRIPGSGVRLELIQYRNPVGRPVDIETKNPGTAHLCLTTDDLDGMSARMASLGATPRSTAPVRITAGPNEGRRVCYFRDPQGFTIEVLEV
jgi:catechol 2,3-dioxygenase-like lactoylglutathione lyase family enzyme